MEADLLNAVFAYVSGLGILPCAYPNVGGAYDTDHIRLSVLPTRPQKLGVCASGSLHTWILQCSVYVRQGVGQVKAAQYVDQLRDGIQYLTDMDGFLCVDDGEAIPSLSIEAWFVFPVQFRISRVL